MKYVAYYRVSTRKQGLGLDAQQAAVYQFINKEQGAIIVGEFSEKETGKNDDRPELEKALKLCKEQGAVLLIAKLDRLSRRVSFIFALREACVRFRALDMPEVNDVLTLAIYAGLAEAERNLISKRTKDALAALKAKGVKLGTNNLTDEGREKGAATMKRKARHNDNNCKSWAFISRWKGSERWASYQAIADSLNKEGLTTARGSKHTPMSVRRLYELFG